jgi:hypothetical protein
MRPPCRSARDLADVVQFVDDPCDQFVNKSDDVPATDEGITRPITRAVRRSGRSALRGRDRDPSRALSAQYRKSVHCRPVSTPPG